MSSSIGSIRSRNNTVAGISDEALDRLLDDARESTHKGDSTVLLKPPLLSALQELKSLRAVLALIRTIGGPDRDF